MNVVWKAVQYFAWRGVKYGVGLGTLYGTALFFLFPISTAFGLVFGGAVGLLAGATCGLLVGLVTIWFFYPLTDPLIYRRVLGIICSITGFRGALVGFCLLFQVDIAELFQGPGIPFIVAPSVIAAAVAAYVSRGFATWYASEKRQKKEKLKLETTYV